MIKCNDNLLNGNNLWERSLIWKMWEKGWVSVAANKYVTPLEMMLDGYYNPLLDKKTHLVFVYSLIAGLFHFVKYLLPIVSTVDF